MLFRTQSFASGHILEANDGGDIASTHFSDLFPIIRMHLHHAADALALTFDWIQHLIAGFQYARVDAKKRQRSDECICRYFEGQCCKGCFVFSLALGDSTVL